MKIKYNYETKINATNKKILLILFDQESEQKKRSINNNKYKNHHLDALVCKYLEQMM